MSEALDEVRGHYRATGLTERLKAALAALGPEERRLAPTELAALDQFHTRGVAATAELAKLAGLSADVSVLDVGAGVGGPARFLAATYGCQVTGVDLSEAFIEAARLNAPASAERSPSRQQAPSISPSKTDASTSRCCSMLR